MKFIVSSTHLLKQLQVLGGVINNSNTLPILDNFLFELNNSKLTVSASDLETTMSSVIEVESDENGSVALPARLLLDTLKTFPEQPLTFVVEDNHTVEISSSYGKYALAYADGNEFPKAVALEDPSSVKLFNCADDLIENGSFLTQCLCFTLIAPNPGIFQLPVYLVQPFGFFLELKDTP